MTIDFNAKIHNRFDVEVIDAVTGKVKQRAQAKNIILTQGWQWILNTTGYYWNNYIVYGSGTGTPMATDTALFNKIASVTQTNRTFAKNIAEGWVSTTASIQLTETVAVGKTITEVGISNTMDTLCTHAMLQDMNGNPISIVKTNTDIINIYATVFAHYGNLNSKIGVYTGKNTTDVSISSGLLYNMLVSGFSSGDSYSVIGYGVASGTLLSATVTRDIANKTRTITAPRIATATANGTLSGIKGVYVGGCHIPAAVFAPSGYSIAGEAIGTGDGTTTSFATKFNAKSITHLYVDGVESTDFTFVDAPLNKQNYAVNYLDYAGRPCSDVYLFGGSSSQEFYINQAEEIIIENPYYATFPLEYIGAGRNGTQLWTSTDMQNWTQISTNIYGTPALSDTYKSNRYFKIQNPSMYSEIYVKHAGDYTHNLHFTTPPASGAVITADYVASTVPKDSNHVFDFTAVFQFGDYSA